jgi:hypothetical protein
VNARVLRWGALALVGFFAMESGFAVFRETVLVGRLSGPGAYVVGLVQALLLLALVAWLLFRAFRPTLTAGAVVRVAFEWLLLGVLLEGLIGRFLRGFSWQEIAVRYQPTSGTGNSLIVAASLFLVPLLVGLAVLETSSGRFHEILSKRNHRSRCSLGAAHPQRCQGRPR